METLQSKKLKALERLAVSNSEELLDKINALLDKENLDYTVPEEHYKVLEEEHQKYLRGELETAPWEAIEKRLRSKYGI